MFKDTQRKPVGESTMTLRWKMENSKIDILCSELTLSLYWIFPEFCCPSDVMNFATLINSVSLQLQKRFSHDFLQIISLTTTDFQSFLRIMILSLLYCTIYYKSLILTGGLVKFRKNNYDQNFQNKCCLQILFRFTSVQFEISNFQPLILIKSFWILPERFFGRGGKEQHIFFV